MNNPVSKLKAKSRRLFVKEIDAVHAQLDRLDSVIESLEDTNSRRAKLMSIRKLITNKAILMKKHLTTL